MKLLTLPFLLVLSIELHICSMEPQHNYFTESTALLNNGYYQIPHDEHTYTQLLGAIKTGHLQNFIALFSQYSQTLSYDQISTLFSEAVTSDEMGMAVVLFPILSENTSNASETLQTLLSNFSKSQKINN